MNPVRRPLLKGGTFFLTLFLNGWVGAAIPSHSSQHSVSPSRKITEEQKDVKFVLQALKEQGPSSRQNKQAQGNSQFKGKRPHKVHKLENDFQLYQQAFAAYKDLREADFLNDFHKLSNEKPSSAFLPHLYLLNAKRLFWSEHFAPSLHWLNQIEEQFPNSDVLKEALYMKVQIYNKLKVNSTALKSAIHKLNTHYAGSSEAELVAFELKTVKKM